MKTIFLAIVLVLMITLGSQAQDNIKWIDAKTLPIEGKGWNDTDSYFERLSSKGKKAVPNLAGYAEKTTGLAIRFSTNSATLKVKWTLKEMPNVIPRQPETGTSGLDLYGKTPENTWTYLTTAIPKESLENEVDFNKTSHNQRTYLLYLPLFNKVTNFEIGIDKDANFTIVVPDKKKQIVFYGTSIVNGIAASRPGMVYSSIIGRRLDCETINLGFAGSAHMEPALCDLLAELNPGLYVIAALENMHKDPITERTLNLVRTIRKSRPNTPIILVEHINWQSDISKNSVYTDVDFFNVQLKKAYNQLINEKVGELYYVEGRHLLGDDGEATVDEVHPSDLGFMRMADIIGKVAKDALTPKLSKGKLKTTVPNL